MSEMGASGVKGLGVREIGSCLEGRSAGLVWDLVQRRKSGAERFCEMSASWWRILARCGAWAPDL